MGFLPTRNFQSSSFEAATAFSGQNLHENFVARNKGCFNCPVSCSRYCLVEEGPYAGTRGEGPEYETISAFGSKCGNADVSSVLRANQLCNQLGLDTISTGNVLAWAMECLQRGLIDRSALDGLELSFGNHQAMLEMLVKIGYRDGVGDLLAEGACRTAERLGGKELVIHSKGLDYPAVDVRGTKGMALSFAVSPRGGDHLKGLCLYEVAPDVYAEDIWKELGIEVTDRYWLQYETKARLMAWQEDWHCVVDALGLCKLEGIALKPLKPEHFLKLFSTATGWKGACADLRAAGERIWNQERLFNMRQGLSKQDDYPPPRLMREPIADGPSRGERLDPEEYERLLLEYYRLRGWNGQSGWPEEATLARLGIMEPIAW
jgi:aldehyde:ferredoxin oxidoreductase